MDNEVMTAENNQLSTVDSQVPDGYKQTEIGIIPEDWQVKEIRDIAPLQRGFDLPNKLLENGMYPVVYSNGILNRHNIYKAKAPGVITGRSGTIGKVTFVEEDYFPHNTTLWVTEFKRNSAKFIYLEVTQLKENVVEKGHESAQML